MRIKILTHTACVRRCHATRPPYVRPRRRKNEERAKEERRKNEGKTEEERRVSEGRAEKNADRDIHNKDRPAKASRP